LCHSPPAGGVLENETITAYVKYGMLDKQQNKTTRINILLKQINYFTTKIRIVTPAQCAKPWIT
jgi:hypothetical protein